MSVDPRRLPCGADPAVLVELVAEGTPVPEGSHQASCPVCQAAFVEFERAWAPVLRWATEPARGPSWLPGAVMTRVRSMSTSSVPVQRTPRGATAVTEWVLALVVAMAVRTTPGLAAAGDRAHRDGRGVLRAGGSESVEATAGGVEIAWDGVGVRVSLPVTIELGHAVDKVAEVLRQRVTADLRHLVGIEASAVDVEVLDVTVPSPSSPRSP